jgi:uncharacterized membrane protein YdjX (TVP38/TMEM64 family)
MYFKKQVVIMLLIAISLILLYTIFPGFRFFVLDAIHTLAQADIGKVQHYLLTFGIWAPFISALLMILAVLIAPLPAFILTFANGLMFGVFWGGVLSWSSALIGAILCFYFARSLGRPVIETFVNDKILKWAEDFFSRYGLQAVITARLIPILSFGIVSYAAGLTPIKFSVYVLGTAIGQIPATILYAYLGEHANESISYLFWLFGLIILLTILGSIFKGRIIK